MVVAGRGSNAEAAKPIYPCFSVPQDIARAITLGAPMMDSQGPLGIFDGAIELLLEPGARASEAMNNRFCPVDIIEPTLD
jgi:hypothetical protein